MHWGEGGEGPCEYSRQMSKCLCLGDEIPSGLPLLILPSSALLKFPHYHDVLLQYKIYTVRMAGRDVGILCKATLPEDPTYVLSSSIPSLSSKYELSFSFWA